MVHLTNMQVCSSANCFANKNDSVLFTISDNGNYCIPVKSQKTFGCIEGSIVFGRTSLYLSKNVPKGNLSNYRLIIDTLYWRIISTETVGNIIKVICTTYKDRLKLK